MKIDRRFLIGITLILFSGITTSLFCENRQGERRDANEAVGLLRAAKFAETDAKLADILKKTHLNPDGHDRFYSIVQIVVINPGISQELLDRWCQDRPNSFYAFLTRGCFYIEYAWNARGERMGYTVSREQGKLFDQRLGKARQDLLKARDLNPRMPYPYHRLITTCMGLGLPKKEMEGYFQAAVRIDPSFDWVYDAKLKFLMPKWCGDEDEMLSFASETAAKAPKRSAAPLILMSAFMEMEMGGGGKGSYLKKPEVWKEIHGVYSRFFNEFPKSAAERAKFARLSAYANNPQKEIMRLFSEALKNDSTHEAVYFERGKYYRYYMRNWESAAADFSKVIDTAPEYEHGDAFLQRGRCLYRLSRYPEAMVDFQTSAAMFHQQDETYLYMGYACFSQKKYGEAISFLSKAIEMKTDDDEAFFYRGKCYLRIKEYVKAIPDYTKFISLCEDKKILTY